MKEFLNLSAAELELASKGLGDAIEHMNFAAIASYFGAPQDPEKVSTYQDKIAKVCYMAPNANPEDVLAYFTPAAAVFQVYTFAHDGTVTTLAVEPETPSSVSFAAIVCPARTIQVIDLNSAKFDLISRETGYNATAMDKKELASVVAEQTIAFRKRAQEMD
jgi:hypothetical protein